MSLVDILHYGNPHLRKKCKPVTDFSILPQLVENMMDTMYEGDGIGLAANQIGVDANLMVIDVTHTDESDDVNIFVNGLIIDSWGESVKDEGCLSIPEVRFDVKRPECIRFKYQTLEGEEKEHEFSGLLARAIQHEVDHLNGVLIIDRVSPIIRMKFKKQLRQIANISQKKINSIYEKEALVL